MGHTHTEFKIKSNSGPGEDILLPSFTALHHQILYLEHPEDHPPPFSNAPSSLASLLRGAQDPRLLYFLGPSHSTSPTPIWSPEPTGAWNSSFSPPTAGTTSAYFPTPWSLRAPRECLRPNFLPRGNAVSVPRRAPELTSPCPAMGPELLLLLLLGLAGKVQKELHSGPMYPALCPGITGIALETVTCVGPEVDL